VFVLDSDHLSILQRKKGNEYVTLQSRLATVPETDVFTTIISFHEQSGGWYKNLAQPRRQRDVVYAYEMLHRVIARFGEMQVLPFDDEAAVQFESLRKQRIVQPLFCKSGLG
jgi:tRNA(fMet)-specific endonuclease VapC